MAAVFKIKYCLKKLGVILDDDTFSNDNCNFFKYGERSFQKLIDFDFEQLQSDILVDKDFSLREITSAEENGLKYLGLFFISNSRRIYNFEARMRLIKIGFEIDDQFEYVHQYNNNDSTIIDNCLYITSRLYELLQESHNNDVIHEDVPNCIQHVALKPSLRPYQSKAVRWLIQREQITEKLTNNFRSIHCQDIPEQKFSIDVKTMEIIDYEPCDIILPTGGILADEMGLGKTVEILALILLHPRKELLHNHNYENDIYELPVKRQKIDSFYCVCVKEANKRVIQCTECKQCQHIACVRKFSQSKHKDDQYICPKCWQNKPLIEIGTTIIVSPHPIKMQWYSEIKKHISCNLDVLVYDGVANSGWISPVELADYDVVLTDYNTLKKEIYFGKFNDFTCNLRQKKKYMNINSPLVMVRWWRVCLDEAQMVESSVSLATQMVQTLPTIHRWAVTGTPIQKSIDDMKGILKFLDAYPFYEDSIWYYMVKSFQNDEIKPLISILTKLMWRTCKSTVLKELGIPPQTEEVHYVTMSDVQKLFYREQHYDCLSAFEEKIKKHIHGLVPLSKIDTRTLNLILEPLRKLRQDCTIPVLFQKSNQTIIKRLLQPQELLEHLKMTNEIECKSQLRTIASSLNGMAALHIIRNEYKDAIRLYEKVLEKSRDYCGTVSVDTLLRIHALHNLNLTFELDLPIDNYVSSKIKEYSSECSKLEWKYIETYYNSFLKAETGFKEANQLVIDTEEKLNDTEGEWWRSLLSEIKENKLDIQLLSRINDEKKFLFGSSLYENFTVVEGIDYMLTTWYDRIVVTREEVLERFVKFKKYTENIKPKNEIDKKVYNEMLNFRKSIFDCHLNTEKSSRKKKLRLCDLCKAEKVLNDYECLIFKKVLNKKTKIADGSWNPTFQETILKVLCSFAKNKNIKGIAMQDGEIFLQLVNCLKEEYKELIKLWIEIEFTVKSYDELDMCKMRLEAVDPIELEEDENKTIYKIAYDDIDNTFIELSAQLQTAEGEFAKKLGRLNYIKHLESNSDPGICPICKQNPDIRYTVLECGHHMCMDCFTGMMKHLRNVLTCAVCRSRQRHTDVYFVTCKPDIVTTEERIVRGNYSSKIEEIVRTILTLRNVDKEVKILIFSHWEQILKEIGKAIEENQINFRSKPTVKCIKEFKENLDVTCLLLPLNAGAKGLNLIEATHVFLVEPILNPGEELQAVGRIHRIGQTKPTKIHRFIVKGTIEENIFNTISNDKSGKWESKDVNINNLRNLFSIDL